MINKIQHKNSEFRTKVNRFRLKKKTTKKPVKIEELEKKIEELEKKLDYLWIKECYREFNLIKEPSLNHSCTLSRKGFCSCDLCIPEEHITFDK